MCKADRLDVTEREAFLAYADTVAEHFGKVNQIYNNAGIAFTGNIEVTQFKDIERVMDVDFWGVVNGTKAFLPHLIASGDGHVVNVSSVFGLFSVPGRPPTTPRSSPSAGSPRRCDRRWRSPATRQGHLRAPRRHQDRDRTQRRPLPKASTPRSWRRTFDKKLASTTPEKAARIILDGVRKNKARILIGNDAKMFEIVIRALGAGYQRMFPKVVARMTPGEIAPSSAPSDAPSVSDPTACPCRHARSRRKRQLPTPRGCSSSHCPATSAGVGALGDLAPHLGQRAGVQNTGELVEREYLRLGQLVAPIQRHHVLRPDQRGVVGQHHQLGRDVGRGGRRPRRVDLSCPQRGE